MTCAAIRAALVTGRLREVAGPHAPRCASRQRTPWNAPAGTWRDCTCGLLAEQVTDYGRTWERPLPPE